MNILKHVGGVLAALLLAAGITAVNHGQTVSVGGQFNPIDNYVVGGTWTWKQGTNPLVFEGVTDDTNETFFAITDPTSDRTITFPDTSGTVSVSGAGVGFPVLSTTAEDAADSIKGVANGIEFEGATADGFESTISFADPGADTTFTFPAADAAVTMALHPGAVITLTDVDLDTTDNSIAAHVCEDQAVTATGVAATDNLIVTMTSVDLAVTFSIGAAVPTAADTVTMRVCNNSVAAADPGAVADFRVVRVVSP